MDKIVNLFPASLSIIRHALTFFGGFLTQAGLISSQELETGIGSVMTLIGIIWSIYSALKKQKQITPPTPPL